MSPFIQNKSYELFIKDEVGRDVLRPKWEEMCYEGGLRKGGWGLQECKMHNVKKKFHLNFIFSLNLCLQFI